MTPHPPKKAADGHNRYKFPNGSEVHISREKCDDFRGKKSAEGPFRKWEVKSNLLGFGNEIICRWENSWMFADLLNEELVRWLNSPSGKRWMEENGVGGGK